MEMMISVSPKTTATKKLKPQNEPACRNCTKSTHLAEPPALQRTPHADHVEELVTGTSDAKAPPVNRRIQTRSQLDVDPKVETIADPHR